jgi:uncharacterized protein (TIGR03083 family)
MSRSLPYADRRAMNLFQAPPVDVRPLLSDERRDLLRFMRTLEPLEWAAPSAALGWSVKDLALHLLDDDLGWLSRGRDGDRTGVLSMSDHRSFVEALAAKNQRWIDGAQGLSAPVIISLLQWAGREMDAYYSTMDLAGDGQVSWAGDERVPIWFDIAQDLTERWVHQMQMREAVGRVEGYADAYRPTVLRTFVWALPHQYRVDASPGTTVQVDLRSGGRWHLTCGCIYCPSQWRCSRLRIPRCSDVPVSSVECRSRMRSQAGAHSQIREPALASSQLATQPTFRSCTATR